MSIENPTLSAAADLAHFRHFSSLFTLSPLYICRESSTNQLLLCKTKPILSAVGGLQMNVNLYNTKDYENKSNWTLGENKPNQSQSKPILERMNVTFCATGGLKLKNSRSFIGLKNFENAVYLHSSAHFLEFSREL